MTVYKQNKRVVSGEWRVVRSLLLFSILLVTNHSRLATSWAADGPRLTCGALSVASTTVTWSPEVGCDVIDLYTGTGNAWQSFRSPAVSVNLTVANNARYDLFAYRSGLSIALQKGPAWASGSSRGTGAGTTELALQDGAWVNAQDIAGLCAAKLCRFMGTLQVNGGGAIALAQANLSGSFTAPRVVNLPDADSTTVVPSTATTNQWVTHIDSAGAQNKSQPASSNLSDSAALVKNNQANTYSAGARQSVVASATTAGFKLGTYAGQPSSPQDGDLNNNNGEVEMYYSAAWRRLANYLTIQAGSHLYCADAGANDAYTCSISPPLTAYTDGMVVVFKPNTSNTGAASININSLGAKTIVTAANATLADNDLTAGRRYLLFYDGTSFRMAQDLNSGGGGTPGGSDTQVQRNNAGAFGGVSGVTSDGTNMTAGSGNLRATLPRITTGLADSNGVNALGVNATASAVNRVAVTNSATGNPVKVGCEGSDANCGVQLVPKGSGALTVGSDCSTDCLTVDPTNVTGQKTVTWPNASGEILLDSSTATLTNKTFDAAATGNTLKFKSYLYLTHPHSCDGTGAVINTTATSADYGHATFSNSADEAGNYCEYRLMVPPDVDTSVAMRAKLKVKLAGADTATQRYVMSMASVADSAADAATVATAINLDFAGDASGASGDVETVGWTTLTGWAAAVTADRLWVIRLARDGNATQDASTVNSVERGLVIEYGAIQ